jgi:hypothetical protein
MTPILCPQGQSRGNMGIRHRSDRCTIVYAEFGTALSTEQYNSNNTRHVSRRS